MKLRLVCIALFAFSYALRPVVCQPMEMNTISLQKIASAPKIDGAEDDPCWRRAVMVDFVDWEKATAPKVPTEALLLYDSQNLYCFLRCYEPKINNLKVNVNEHDGQVWTDDCVEIFIQPNEQGGYYHLAINPAGVLYDIATQGGSSWESNSTVATKILEDRWNVEIAMPFSALGRVPSVNDIWRLNLGRERRAGKFEISCWSCTQGFFHKPRRFGYIIFSDLPITISTRRFNEIFLGRNLIELDLMNQSDRDLTFKVAKLIRATSGKIIEQSNVKISAPAKRAIQQDFPFDLKGEEDSLCLMVRRPDNNQVLYLKNYELNIASLSNVSKLRTIIERATNLKADKNISSSLIEGIKNKIQSGAKMIAQFDEMLDRAIKNQKTIDRNAWLKLNTQMASLIDSLNRPVIWTQSPMDDITPNAMPKSIENIKELTAIACINEYEPWVLNISNIFSADDTAYRVSLSDLVNPFTKSKIEAAKIELREAIFIRKHNRQWTGDPLSLVNQVGTIHVPSGRTAQLWINPNTFGVPFGDYLGKVTLYPVDALAGVSPISIALKLKVLPIELPEKMPITVFDWDYSKCGSEPFLKDLLAHRVNAFHITGIPTPAGNGKPTDFSALDGKIEKVKGKGTLMLEFWFMRGTGWQKHYEQWFRDFVTYLKGKGLSYDEFVMYPFDEYIGPKFVEVAKQMKRIDPNVKIFSDRTGKVEQLEAIAPYIDYWCPPAQTLGSNPEGLEFMRKTGKPIWTYLCGSGKGVTPMTNRLLPWRSYKYKLQGCTFWTYMSGYGDLWNDLDQGHPDWTKVYPDRRGEPLPSRRWEAWREGLEDYCYLYLLEQTLKEAKVSGKTPEGEMKRASTLLKERVDDVLQAGKPDVLYKARGEIVKTIMSLRGLKYNPTFVATGLLDWRVVLVGDSKGKVELLKAGRKNDYVYKITSGTERSWSFLLCNITAKKGDTVTATVWVKPIKGRLKVVLTDGFIWGGNPSGHVVKSARPQTNNQWQKVTLSLKVKENPVSFGAGFDYYNPKAEALIEIAVVETVR